MRARTTRLAWLAAILVLPGPALAQDEIQPPIKTKNSNALIKEHHKQLQLSSSSSFDGWPESKALDGDPKTSWFSEQDDSVAKGKTPWIELKFPDNVEVKHVTVLGNREPEWLNGYTVLKGKLELIDADGKVVFTKEAETTDKTRDFDFVLPKGMKIRSVRFTSLGDQGDMNDYGDIAIGEIQIE